MIDAPKKKRDRSALARRASAQVKSASDSEPVVYVVPPIANALDAIQSVVATEVAFMQRAQIDGARLDLKDAKKLAALTSALAQATNTKRDVIDDELSNKTDAEIEAELVAELEAIRSRTKKVTP